VVDKDDTRPQGDEVILPVHSSSLLVKVAGVIFIGLVALFYDTPYRAMTRGDYLEGVFLGFTCLGLLVAGVDILSFKHILFHRDRVVKVWYLFGQRTIPYARAKLAVNPAWTRSLVWLAPAKGKPEPFRIYETDGGSKVRLLQIPIGYGPLGVAPETLDRVAAVISYLVGVEDRAKLYEESRIFAESELPKELLGRG
jgi:hypothetical protein